MISELVDVSLNLVSERVKKSLSNQRLLKMHIKILLNYVDKYVLPTYGTTYNYVLPTYRTNVRLATYGTTYMY